jgi:hypothetical protein
MAPKLIVIIGITGNQGGSVAARFLQDPNYRIRGITRDNTTPASLALVSKGVELVTANLDSVAELKEAFKGANLIFSVTNYWEPFFRPDCRAEAEEKGISCRRYAYDVELQQGKNIADAAASVAKGLDENGFIVSTLSFARECSKGQFQELYHFDGKAEVFPGYVVERWPDLEKKMSCVQTGYFMKSYKLAMGAYFAKVRSCFQSILYPDRFASTMLQIFFTPDLEIETYVFHSPKMAGLISNSSKMEVSRCLSLWQPTHPLTIWPLMKTLELSSTQSPKCHPGRVTWPKALIAVGVST